MVKASTRRLLLPLSVLLFGIVALGFAAYVSFSPNKPSSARAPAIGGPFSLVAHDGRHLTDADFRGEPFLVFFGYTHCPDVCPTTLFELSDVLHKVGPDKKVAALFITIDPERDTPAALKDYLSSFDPRIIGLSGDEQSIEAVKREYRVYAQKVPREDGEYTMDHTALVYLMDKEGRFVGAFNLQQPPEAAAADLAKFL